MDLSEMQRLPEELIIQVIFPLLDSTSRARAAAVCRSWRYFSRRAPPVEGGIPWLLLADDLLNYSLLQPPISFPHATPHRPSSFEVKLKNSKYDPDRENGKFIVASHKQYVMRHRQHSHSGVIHDVFTGEKIKLSPAACCWPLARLSHLNNLPKPNLVAVTEDCQGHVYIYRSWMDDDKWKCAILENWALDFVLHKEQLFCVNKKRGIKAMHVLNPNLQTKWPDSGQELDHVRIVVPAMVGKDIKYPGATLSYHLVDSWDGLKLWLVTQYDIDDWYKNFEVHEVVEGGLVEVTDLGDAMLFVGDEGSISCRSSFQTSLSPASPEEFFTKNSIYYSVREDSYKFWLAKFTLGQDYPTFHPFPIRSYYSPVWINPVVRIN